jgi:hypothetical protein
MAEAGRFEVNAPPLWQLQQSPDSEIASEEHCEALQQRARPAYWDVQAARHMRRLHRQCSRLNCKPSSRPAPLMLADADQRAARCTDLRVCLRKNCTQSHNSRDMHATRTCSKNVDRRFVTATASMVAPSRCAEKIAFMHAIYCPGMSTLV